MPVAGGDSSGVWKWLTMFLAGICITLIGCLAQQNKDMATKKDIADAVALQQNQMDKIEAHTDRIDDSLSSLHESMGAVKQALGVKTP